MTALSDMLCDLIETLWNVKIFLILLSIASFFDLIETLWNVKIILKQYTGVMHVDLIETLWNVKLQRVARWGGIVSGFNRDIVECKVKIA